MTSSCASTMRAQHAASRRSRRSVTLIWPWPGWTGPARQTARTRWWLRRILQSTCSMHSPPPGPAGRCASAFTLDLSWPASSAAASSHTTCGATPSTSRAGSKPRPSRAAFMYRKLSPPYSRATSPSSRVARSSSRARARRPRGSSRAGGPKLPSVGQTPETVAQPSPRTQHQALYRRWRSQTFGEVVAQDAVIETLRNAVRLNRLSHGLLFVGPRGTGKTSTARIVAKAVNCPNAIDGEPDDTCPSCVAIRDGRALDVVELDAASNNRVDDMRELLPRVYTAAADLKRKVFIIDEVQRIKEGWDVLLKTLEEPPPDVLFIFCTTDPSGIRPAVVSRLQRFTFRPLPEGQIRGKLRRIAEAEGRNVTDEAVELIAQRAAGGMRDAESMLDQVISSGVETIDADAVRDLLGLADLESVDRFVAALAEGDALAGIRLLDQLEADGRDLVAFADQVVSRLRELLVESLAQGNRSAERSARLARAARRLAGLDINRGAAGGYRLQLELALLEPTFMTIQTPTQRAPADNGPLALADSQRPQAPRPAPQAPPAPAPKAAPKAIPVRPEPAESLEPPAPAPVESSAPSPTPVPTEVSPT